MKKKFFGLAHKWKVFFQNTSININLEQQLQSFHPFTRIAHFKTMAQGVHGRKGLTYTHAWKLKLGLVTALDTVRQQVMWSLRRISYSTTHRTPGFWKIKNEWSSTETWAVHCVNLDWPCGKARDFQLGGAKMFLGLYLKRAIKALMWIFQAIPKIFKLLLNADSFFFSR